MKPTPSRKSDASRYRPRRAYGFRVWLFVVGAASGLSCTHRLRSLSTRQVEIAPRGTGSLHGTKGTPPGGLSKPVDIYVRRKETVIKPVAELSHTGSLHDADSPYAHLVVNPPHAVGRYLALQVQPVRRIDTSAKSLAAAGGKGNPSGAKPDNKDDKPAESPAASPPAAAAAAAGAPTGGSASAASGKDAKAAGPDDLGEILAQMPTLAPADGGALILPQLSVKIMDKRSNGDLAVRYDRSSASATEVRSITFDAVIPQSSLAAGQPLSTKDLVEIEWREVGDAEEVRRFAGAWDDDLTFRVSGMTEAKSRAAQSLHAREQRLDEARKMLSNRIESFAKERQTVAAQRDEMTQRQKESQDRVSQLEKTVEDQKSKIESLTPPEDRGRDSEDAASRK